MLFIEWETYTSKFPHMSVITPFQISVCNSICMCADRYTYILQNSTAWADTIYQNSLEYLCKNDTYRRIHYRRWVRALCKPSSVFLSVFQVCICSIDFLFHINTMCRRKVSLLRKPLDVRKMWSLPDLQSSPMFDTFLERHCSFTECKFRAFHLLL